MSNTIKICDISSTFVDSIQQTTWFGSSENQSTLRLHINYIVKDNPELFADVCLFVSRNNTFDLLPAKALKYRTESFSNLAMARLVCLIILVFALSGLTDARRRNSAFPGPLLKSYSRISFIGLFNKRPLKRINFIARRMGLGGRARQRLKADYHPRSLNQAKLFLKMVLRTVRGPFVYILEMKNCRSMQCGCDKSR